MDLLSGYSDNTNYGNGYTPQVNNAFNNNNNAYNANQAAVNQAGQYDPFAQSGGFGNQTAYYAGQGAAYTGATGGDIYSGGGGGGGGDGYWNTDWYRAMNGIGSDAARAPDQPGNNPGAAPYSQPGGYNPFDPGIYAPSPQKNLARPSSINPAMELPYYVPQWNYDKPLDQTPQNVFGNPGTRDNNVMDPSELPGGGYSIPSQRDQLAQAMQYQPWVNAS